MGSTTRLVSKYFGENFTACFLFCFLSVNLPLTEVGVAGYSGKITLHFDTLHHDKDFKVVTAEID